jgi:DNA invertase Pin-like site-specific DNA recombinase
MRAAIYARVSTLEQEPENQLQELRRFVVARGWIASVEYVDKGVSGAKDRRPALDQLVGDAKRRKFDVLVCWRLDRLGRNLRHLILLLDELSALGVSFVSLGEPLGQESLDEVVHLLAMSDAREGAVLATDKYTRVQHHRH